MLLKNDNWSGRLAIPFGCEITVSIWLLAQDDFRPGRRQMGLGFVSPKPIAIIDRYPQRRESDIDYCELNRPSL